MGKLFSALSAYSAVQKKEAILLRRGYGGQGSEKGLTPISLLIT